MKLLRYILGLVAAAVLHTLGSRWIGDFSTVADLFLVLAVNNSLSTSPGWSAAGGSAAGLARDALSGGLYGLYGFADTLVAYLSARVQQRLLIRKPLQVACLFAVAALTQLAVLAALQGLLLAGGELPGIGAIAARAVLCGLLGFLLFVLSSRLESSLRNRRERRRRRLTIAV